MAESKLGPATDRVETFLRRSDYTNARLALLSGVRDILAERYPFAFEDTDFGLAMTHNGHLLTAIGAVVHDLTRSNTRLDDLQKAEIGLAVARLRQAHCKTRILIVRNERIQGAVLRDLSDQLGGVEVWNVIRLPELDLPIRL